MSASPATGELMPLTFAAARLIALSRASGPSSSPPLIWPRSAILHSAAASIVEGIFEVTVSTADRMATLAARFPALRQVDRVLHDVDLVLQRGQDVDRGVGNDQRLAGRSVRP